MSTVWPAVVDHLLTLLPTLPGWDAVEVYDTDPVTSDVPADYAVVARTSDDTTSGNYVRSLNINGFMVDEAGTVRVHIVTRTGDVDPSGVRASGFALADALQDALIADQTLGGVLGAVGTVDVTVDVQSVADPRGTAQSLIVSLNYTSLT